MTPTPHEPLFRSVLDRLIPEDEYPGAWEAGVGDFITRYWDTDFAIMRELILGGLMCLEQEARVRHEQSFVELGTSQQDELISCIEKGELAFEWIAPPDKFFEVITMLAAQGYYGDPGNGGNRDGRSWEMIGFRQGTVAGYKPPPPSPALSTADPRHLDGEYDAIVVGSGAGGGVTACVLAEAGMKVLLVERGRSYGDAEIPVDHLRNQRFSVFGVNAGPEPEGHPRVAVDAEGNSGPVPPHAPTYQNCAMCVGGGTRVYSGLTWRLHPDDFRMGSLYGRPEGSSLADWPITYDDLEAYYDQAEWEIGVAGPSSGHKNIGPRRRGYPMPPIPPNLEAEVLARGATALKWNTASVPMAVNTEPRDGRDRCGQCGLCGGFACPSNSKNGVHNTVLPRALATGSCTLVAGAHVARIEANSGGRVQGVSGFALTDGEPRPFQARAPIVVVSAGAVESARLLLLSKLGNEHDQVGRNLQNHMVTACLGVFRDPVKDGQGPGCSIATCDLVHGNPGVIGGAVLTNDVVQLPVQFWMMGLPPDVRRWGSTNKEYMRHAYTRTASVGALTQEIPTPEARVTLDPEVRDRFGLPVARVAPRFHPETVKAADYLSSQGREWLNASGAERSWGFHIGAIGPHQAGTCRMGNDPQSSVTDPWGRVHGCEGLWVVDGSLHVTNGGVNPALTIFALAFRNAREIAQRAGRGRT